MLINDLIFAVFGKFEARHKTVNSEQILTIALNQHSILYNIHRIIKILGAKD